MPFARPFRRPYLEPARIKLLPTGRFEFAPQGEFAITMGVADDLGLYLDIVAWPIERPDEWYTANGRACVLGLEEILFAAAADCDLMLVETPARWADLATTGPWVGPTACVIDWQQSDALRVALSMVRGIRCETELARAVEAILHGVPARQRLRISTAEPVKPAAEAPREREEFDGGTTIEPYPLGELGDVHAADDRKQLVD